MLCSYGCGKEAVKQFKNGVFCCNEIAVLCPEVLKKSPRSKGKKLPPRTKKHKENLSLSHLGQKCWCKGLTKETNEILREKANKQKGKKRGSQPEEWRRNISIGNTGKKKGPRSEESKRKQGETRRKKKIKPSRKCIEANKQWMNNGGAAYTNSFNTNPSKLELNLRVIVKDLYPTSEHTYKVLENRGYEVDNALVEYKIAIEYDGWYHFDTEERRVYHKKRQKEIEEDGWKFLRYNIFQKFPTLEQVKEDINKLLDKE